jgi:hypothetical protein
MDTEAGAAEFEKWRPKLEEAFELREKYIELSKKIAYDDSIPMGDRMDTMIKMQQASADYFRLYGEVCKCITEAAKKSTSQSSTVASKGKGRK